VGVGGVGRLALGVLEWTAVAAGVGMKSVMG